MPTLSKKSRGHQEDVDWLTFAAKARFDEVHALLLASWGVRPGHSGTCVLIPKKWNTGDPLDFVNEFIFKECPSRKYDLLSYKYSDHIVSFARALAWFQGWPRTAGGSHFSGTMF